MNPRSWLTCGVRFILIASLATSGCAKRVAVDDGAFEAQESVVLSFTGDRSLHGKIDTGSPVLYLDAGSSYRASILSVSESTIILEDVILERSSDSVEEAVYRLSDARVAIDEDMGEIVLLRSEIEEVERIRFDGTRTLRNVTFWTLSSVVFGFLLGERS